MLNLQNKNILITGASRGFGYHLAEDLWKQGANLYLVSRTRPKLSFAQTLEEQFYVWCSYDLYDLDESSNLFVDFFEYFKSIDVLINNAATQEPIGKAWEVESSQWEDNIKLNLFTPVRLSKLFINRMIIQKYGKIINLSGGGSTSSRPNFSAYAVAKTGLVRFSEILAEEVREYNIQVNCISPGAMNTAMMDEIIQNSAAGEEERENAINTMKIHSIKTMENATKLVNWLISDDSNHVTGRLISAQWDKWEKDFSREYVPDDFAKLRRVTEK